MIYVDWRKIFTDEVRYQLVEVAWVDGKAKESILQDISEEEYFLHVLAGDIYARPRSKS